MARQADLTAVNCTSCGAGLDVLGGGRVTTHICPYCGTELDAQDNYKALQQFADMPRPKTPFSIGMQGQIHGVDYTIIGTLGFEEGRWRWTDHQLFSPTHGYAWLTVENGHITFTRRYRKQVLPSFMTHAGVELAENRPTARTGGAVYRYYESSITDLVFAEGEFTWRPKVGDLTYSVTCMSDTAQLTFVDSDTEREVERSTYLNAAETLAAFGAEPAEPVGNHPLAPYRKQADEGVRKLILGGAAAASIALLIGLSSGSGSVLAPKSFGPRDLPAEVSFDISKPGKLARINLAADVSNSWAELDISVTGPDDEPIFEAGRLVERYSGRDSEGSWTEGSGKASLKFRPETAGTYTIEMDLAAAETWQRTGTAVSTFSVWAKEGIVAPGWLIFSSLFLGLGAAFVIGRPWLHHRRRWAGSDWVEEDDD